MNPLRALIGTAESDRLDVPTRVVVSPAPGVFEPSHDVATSVRVGEVIGHIVSPSSRVAVTSPFAGEVANFVAWPQERVRKYQMLLSLNALPTRGAA